MDAYQAITRNPKPLPTNPIDRANVEHVLQHGYVVLENCFTKEEAQEAKDEMVRLNGKNPSRGRNAFEGLNTNRIYSLINKSRVFDKFAILPQVLALNDYFLDPGYMISAFHTIQINPGEAPQDMHHGLSYISKGFPASTDRIDDRFVRVPRPRMPFGSAIILAFDDFTTENGATGVIPGSHLWADQVPKYEDTIPMVCPAGSAVFFIATTWHCGGQNKSNASRMSATVQYCQPYIRPIENQILAVDPRKLKDIPPSIVNMMGYRVHRPFVGYADGLNPRKAAQRMVDWLQKPVDNSPPTFAHTGDLGSKL
ncbi:hypothetical protein FQN57_006302 [Myotisia sp. PD_48]|nr:hypothetical protein FQN57_006302 [Myotisia sp. PD_48]